MNANDRTLWMGDLETYMDATFLSEAFARMGETVQAVKVVHDKYSGRPAGYCFIELGDGDAARRVMLNVNGKVIPKSRPPSTFNLSFANSPSAPYTEYNLFVNNVPLDIDDAGLFLVFGERYRSCRGAKVYRNPDGSSRGAGFVRFADQTDQQKALVEMNKFVVNGEQITLKLAQPKFRAPRGQAAAAAARSYDPASYYPQFQDFYNSPQWRMYDFQAQQQQQAAASAGLHQQAQQMMAGAPPQLAAPMGFPQLVSLRPGQAPPAAAALMQQPPPQQHAVHIVQRVAVEPEDSRHKPSGVAPPPVQEDDPDLQLELYDEAKTLEQINFEFILRSEEFYVALEESKWTPKLQTASVTEKDL